MQKNREKRMFAIYLREEYVKTWPYLLSQYLGTQAFIRLVCINDNSYEVIGTINNGMLTNEVCPDQIDFPDQISGRIHVFVIYENGFIRISQSIDLLDRWMLIIGHFYETKNIEQHIMIEEMIKDFMSNIEDKEAEKKSQREKTWMAWFKCFLP
jgi:hypothetical protein